MEIGFYRELAKTLGVPVIDPSVAALKRQCGWSPSRRWSSEAPAEEELARFGGFDEGEAFGARIVVPAGAGSLARKAA